MGGRELHGKRRGRWGGEPVARGGGQERLGPAWVRSALEEKPPGDMANGEVGGRRRRREAGGADEVGEGERDRGERECALGIY